jgi:hypothetical protein
MIRNLFPSDSVRRSSFTLRSMLREPWSALSHTSAEQGRSRHRNALPTLQGPPPLLHLASRHRPTSLALVGAKERMLVSAGKQRQYLAG